MELIIDCILWETYFGAKWVDGIRLDGPMMQFTPRLGCKSKALTVCPMLNRILTFCVPVATTISVWLPLKMVFWNKVWIGQCSSTSAEESHREENLKNIKPTGEEITRTAWQEVCLLTINKKRNLGLALDHRNLCCVCCWFEWQEPPDTPETARPSPPVQYSSDPRDLH